MRIVSQQALQVALDSAKTGSGASAVGSFVPIRRATINIADTINIKDVRGTRGWGDALGGTTLNWTGPADRPMFLIDGCDSVELAYFTVRVSNPLLSVFKITDQGAGVSKIRSTRIRIHDIDVEDSDGALTDVIWIALTADLGKNDQHSFERVTAKDYAGAFAKIEGQASVGNVFVDCKAQGRDHGQYGIYCAAASGPGRGGQFYAENCVLMEHQQYDCYGDWRAGASKLVKVTCEQSARFLGVASAGASFSGHSLTVDGGEWVNNAAVHPADKIIVNAAAGGLHIQGMTFGQSANVNDYKFNYLVSPSTKRLGWTFRNNVLWTPLTSGWFPGELPDDATGSWVRSGSAATVAL